MIDQHPTAAGSEEVESALAGAQSRAEAALRLSAAVTRELKKARTAAVLGQLRELRRALDAAQALAADLADQVEDDRSRHTLDDVRVLADGSFAAELLAAAHRAGVSIVADEGQLLCYPSLVRILPSDLAVQIDRRRERRLRPSVLVQQLKAAQQAGPRFKAAPFLASLAGAYDYVLARDGKERGAVVKLTDVYAVLTLLPGQARDYSRQEFARDLYLLDHSGETTVASSGRRLRWAASTGTKQAGVLSTVARSGQVQRYWGIAFQEATHA